MTSIESTKISPGIYQISVALNRHNCLTRLPDEKRVTIAPLPFLPDPNQEWRITHGDYGNIVIDRPSKIFPSEYLAYKKDDRKPEPGDLIVLQVSEFPPNEWHVKSTTKDNCLIRVAGSELGIFSGPPNVEHPILSLGVDEQVEWVFERKRDE